MNPPRTFATLGYSILCAILLLSSLPASGSLARTHCVGIRGVDGPVFSSCSRSNVYSHSGQTLTQNGDAWADLSLGQIKAIASGDKYFSIGYAGSASGLLQDVIMIQGQGSNWATDITITMTIDGMISAPPQNPNISNLVADTYLSGFSSLESSAANTRIFWDGTGFTANNAGSEGRYSVDVLASGTNNYSVQLIATYEVSELFNDINLTAYLNATGGSTTTGTLVSDFGSTAQLGVVLPAGYSFTSESGVLLSAIPIPPAFWLFVSGLLGLIGIARQE